MRIQNNERGVVEFDNQSRPFHINFYTHKIKFMCFGLFLLNIMYVNIVYSKCISSASIIIMSSQVFQSDSMTLPKI